MSMKTLKNLFRLSEIYIPLFLTVFLAVILILFGEAVVLSCTSVKKGFADLFPVTLQVSHKVRNEYFINYQEKTQIGDSNTTKVDSALMDHLYSLEDISDIQYIGNSFSITKDNLISISDFETVSEAVNNIEIFDFSGYFGKSSSTSYVVRGVSSLEMLEKTFPDITKIKFLDDAVSMDGGIIISEDMYELFGRPEYVVVGWYQTFFGSNKLKKDENGNFIIDDDIKLWIKNISNRYFTNSGHPFIKAKVLGYYENSVAQNTVYAGMDVWNIMNALERFQKPILDYKTGESIGPDKYALETDTKDVIGLEYITAKIKDPSKAPEILQSFLDAGYSADDYNIVITDYDYKFAVAQIEGLQKLAESAGNASIIIGILITAILIYFASRRRSGEIYTLRTLGETRGRIVIRMTAEIAIVIIAAVLAGVLFGELFGNTVCAYVNDITLKNAAGAAERLSEAFQLMKNKDEVLSQMTSAIESFNKADIGITYSVEARSYILLSVSSVLAIIYTALALLAQSFKNLMKERGN